MGLRLLNTNDQWKLCRNSNPRAKLAKLNRVSVYTLIVLVLTAWGSSNIVFAGDKAATFQAPSSFFETLSHLDKDNAIETIDEGWFGISEARIWIVFMNGDRDIFGFPEIVG